MFLFGDLYCALFACLRLRIRRVVCCLLGFPYACDDTTLMVTSGYDLCFSYYLLIDNNCRCQITLSAPFAVILSQFKEGLSP